MSLEVRFEVTNAKPSSLSWAVGEAVSLSYGVPP